MDSGDVDAFLEAILACKICTIYGPVVLLVSDGFGRVYGGQEYKGIAWLNRIRFLFFGIGVKRRCDDRRNVYFLGILIVEKVIVRIGACEECANNKP